MNRLLLDFFEEASTVNSQWEYQFDKLTGLYTTIILALGSDFKLFALSTKSRGLCLLTPWGRPRIQA
jgi:hypothetical protein